MKTRQEYLDEKYGEVNAVYTMVRKLGEESQGALATRRGKGITFENAKEIWEGFADISMECAKLLDTIDTLRYPEGYP